MIYTLTLNPALDYFVTIKTIKTGQVNVSESEEIICGGKGINVSAMLSNLGVENTALGFIAGFTGDEIERRVKQSGTKTSFIRLDNGYSRINVKIKSSDETEINAPGPVITRDKIEQLSLQLSKLSKGDIIVLSGSIPSGLSDNIYSELLQAVDTSCVSVVADTAGKALIEILKFRPFLIKPNHHELSDLFGVKLSEPCQITAYAKKLQEMGAQNVLVSMAEKGAVLVDKNGGCRHHPIASGTLVSSIGAGDSMVAGFLAGYLKTSEYDYGLKLGTAAGAATAFSSGIASAASVYKVFEQLQ